MNRTDFPADSAGWLIVGRVTKPHGIRGGVTADIITDFPERLTGDMEVGLGPAEGPAKFLKTHAVRAHRGRWLLEWDGVRDRDAAEELRGLYLFLPPLSREELPEGFFYEHHLVGLDCRSPEGEALGRVIGLDLETGGQTRAVVEREGREFLVPWVDAFIRGVDLEAGVVTIDAPPGLLDDDADEA